jgi:hypothetical protein
MRSGFQSRGQVGGEGLPEERRVDRKLHRRLRVVPGRILALDQGRVEDAVVRLALDVRQPFAFVWDEAGDVD